jgi:integrase
MARRKTLTDAGVNALTPRPSPYPDPELPGHYIRSRPSGIKTFVAVARAPNGRQVWHTIGPSTLYTIAVARERARTAMLAIREGRGAPEPFEQVAENWYKRHVEAKGLISAPDLRSCLDRQLIPAWRGRDFSSIRRGDVAGLLDSIEDTNGPVAADFALAVFRMLANWYASRNEDYASPIVKGMRRTNPKARARSRVLSDDELREVWRVAKANGTFGAFIRVALLTAQRREKLVTMKWADLERDEWIIQRAEREKGTAGSLVLPDAALNIINSQPRFASNPYVFAGIGGGYIQGMSKRKAQFDAKLSGVAPWTIHDLRRTARTLMERAGLRPDIAERVLGHAIGGVAGIYNRHQYQQEKAHALRALAGLIDNILRPEAEVLRLRVRESNYA